MVHPIDLCRYLPMLQLPEVVRRIISPSKSRRFWAVHPAGPCASGEWPVASQSGLDALRRALSGRRRETLLYMRCMRIGGKNQDIYSNVVSTICSFVLFPPSERILDNHKTIFSPDGPLAAQAAFAPRVVHCSFQWQQVWATLNPYHHALHQGNEAFAPACETQSLSVCFAWQSTNCGVVPQVFLLSACALSVSFGDPARVVGPRNGIQKSRHQTCLPNWKSEKWWIQCVERVWKKIRVH